MGYMTKKIIVAFVAAMLAFTNILATPAAVAEDCPLCEPARFGSTTEVKRLIAAGADLNAEDYWGTALMWAAAGAAAEGHAEVVKILLDAGADVNAKNDRWDSTALMKAATNWQSAEIVKILLDAGADVNAKSKTGSTALMGAKGEAVKILLDAGAYVNAKDKHGITALMWAAWSWGDDAETVKILLDAGANANVTGLGGNTKGKTALMLAKSRGNTNVINLMKNYKPVTTLPLVEVARAGNLDEVQRLIAEGADVNAKDNNGETVLMAAAEKGHAEMVKILLDAGANTNVTSSEGKTVLDYATPKTLPVIIMAIKAIKVEIMAECSEVKVDTPLPPKVYIDRKLVEVTRILDGEDYLSAAIMMKFIRCYGKTNNITLPSEFLFKESQILLLTQLPQAAKSAVIRYLQESGQDGEHYLEALQLFDELESQ